MSSAVLTDDHKLTANWKTFLEQAKGVSSATVDDAFRYEAAVETPATSEGFIYEPDLPIKAIYNSRQNFTTFQDASIKVGDNGDIVLLSFDSLPQTVTLDNVLLGFGVLKAPGGNTAENVIDKIINAIGLGSVLVVDQSPQNRNATWLIPAKAPVKDLDNMKDPMVTLQTVTSLTFKLNGPAITGFIQQVTSVLDHEFGTSLGTIDGSDLEAIAKLFSFTVSTTTTGTLLNDSTYDITVTPKLTFTVRLKGFIVNLIYERNDVSLNVQEASKTGDLFTKLSNLMSGGSDDDPAVSSSLAALRPVIGEGHIHLRNVSFGKDFAGTMWWEAQFYCEWVIRPEVTVWIGLAYDNRTKTFEGGLLFENDFANEVMMLLPYFDESMRAPGTMAKVLNLHDLFVATKSLPDNVPYFVSQATLRLIHEESPARFELAFAIESQPPDKITDAGPVPSPFVWSSLVINVTQQGPDVTVHVDTAFQVNPRPEDVALYTPATMTVNMDYDSGKGNFDLVGEVDNLQFGALANYADPSCSSAFSAIFGKLVLSQLLLRYTIDKTSNDDGTSSNKASSFLLLGKIRLGLLELDLVYQYTSDIATETATEKQLAEKPDAIGKIKPIAKPTSADKSTGWTFEAYLGAANIKATLAEVVGSIDQAAADALPGFVGDIEIAPSGAGDSPVRLTLSKTSPPAKSGASGSGSSITTAAADTALVLTLEIAVGPIDFTFVQLCENGKTSTTTQVTTTAPPIPKRLLRVKVGELPHIADIPILKELTQPFQACQYMYVGAGGALTTDDVEAINPKLGDANKLFYRQSNTPSNSEGGASGTSDKGADKKEPVTALVMGHHLIVVHEGKCILDHAFSNAKSTIPEKSTDDGKDSNKKDPAKADDNAKGADKANDKAGDETAPTKGALKAHTKLFSLDSVALQFKDGYLWIMLDVTVALGPVALTLLGFGIGLPLGDISLSPRINDLAALGSQAKFQIHGVGVSFEKPPLVIAGVFEHEIMKQLVGDPPVEQTLDAYRGGIGISYPPYTFVAVGQYAEATFRIGGSYKSLFVFAKLDGPLIQLEFGECSISNHVPTTISGVRIGFGYNSMIRSPSIEELTQFPLIGELPGVGNNPINLLQAWCKGDNPWVVPKQDSYWFAVGMTITAFDILKITAAALLAFRDSGIIVSLYADAVAQVPPDVTKTSDMILYVEIGLVAEMNFIDCYFRCDASLAPTSFLLVPEPSHYPNPKRLGISFTVGHMVHIQGEGYFAITPKVVMGGAMIHVSLQVGIVSAYLDASFDALINLHPIHYMADVHVAIGVSCDIDILFITIHISVSIGADLHIEGPEFGGVAHVDFWVFGFDVYFGDQGKVLDPLTLSDFYDMVHKAGPTSGRPPATGPETVGLDQQIKLTLEDGAFSKPSQDTAKADAQPDSSGAGSKWFVKGVSFAFRVAPDFAISIAQLINDKEGYSDIDKAKIPAKDTPAPLRSTPMHLSAPHPERSQPDPGHPEISSTLKITIRSAAGKLVPITGWKPTYVVKDVPSALWRDYDESRDPMIKGGGQELLSPANGTIKQIMAVSLVAPDPILSKSNIPAFNATDAQKSEVLTDDGKSWTMPTPGADQTQDLLPAPLTHPIDPLYLPQKWKEMQTTWQTCSADGLDLATGMAALCATTLGWDAPLPGQLTGPKITDVGVKPAWMLTTDLPKRLVVGTKKPDDPKLRDVMDGLENFYLALPRVATAA
nr:hypothetical protein B0A51_02550 [Rachicladosporium sp. CCFEE 5018]